MQADAAFDYCIRTLYLNHFCRPSQSHLRRLSFITIALYTCLLPYTFEWSIKKIKRHHLITTKNYIMRKVFLAALLTITVTAGALAKEVNAKNVRAVRNFEIEFINAENVSWTIRSNFAKASFDLNGEKREAFYDLHGDLIGTSKNISLEKLPVSAKRVLANKYDGYSIKEVIHFEGVDEAAYYISAENEKESVILKVSDSNSVSEFKKERKN